MNLGSLGLLGKSWHLRVNSGAGAALVTFLLVATGASGGIVVPPYQKVVPMVFNYSDSGGCGGAGQTGVRADWNSTSSVGHFFGKVSAKSCSRTLGGVGVYAYGDAGAEFDLAVPVAVGTTGAHKVTANGSFTWTNSARISIGGPCPAVVLSSTGGGYTYCAASAAVSVFGFAYLYDLTNGSYFASAGPWVGLSNQSSLSNYTACYNFYCYYYNNSYPAPGSPKSVAYSWMFNGTMDSTHQYVLVAYIFASASVYMYGAPNGAYPHSRASAYIDLATLRDGVRLGGIAII